MHVTWSRGGGQPIAASDGSAGGSQSVYLVASDGSLIVNATADVRPQSLLGAVYTCYVTNGMTSDTRRMRLGRDVIAAGASDWSALSWMSVNSVAGIQINYNIEHSSCAIIKSFLLQ